MIHKGLVRLLHYFIAVLGSSLNLLLFLVSSFFSGSNTGGEILAVRTESGV